MRKLLRVWGLLEGPGRFRMNDSKRKSNESKKLHYEMLEPKQLLAADLTGLDTPRAHANEVPHLSHEHTVVGNYRNDFAEVLTGENDQWQFVWNAPFNWSPWYQGNLRTGGIDDVQMYRPMIADGNNFRPTSAASISLPARNLEFNANGGHAGIQSGRSTGNVHDRFAIAAFVVEESGYYAIGDSFLTKSSTVGDGVEIIVRVGDEPVALNRSAAAGPNYKTDFDTNLGFVAAGEVIYVGVGSDGDHRLDSFDWDFSVYRFDGAKVADWNSGFQHVNFGQSNIPQLEQLPPNRIARRHVFSDSGFYAISASEVTFNERAQVLVHDNDGKLLHRVSGANNQTGNLDLSLGYVTRGDSIYVTVVPFDNSANPTDIQIEFDVVSEPMTRALPMRELDTQITVHVDDFGANGRDQNNDRVSIQQAINHAIRLQRSYNVPVAVQLGEGTYKLGAVDAINLLVQGARDLKITGLGADQTTLMLTDPLGGLMRVMDSHNILISDFSVDYETLPFTQGRVTQIVDAHTAVLRVDGGYVAPDDPNLFGPWLRTHRTQFLHASRSGRLVDGSDFYWSRPELTQRNQDGSYTVTYEQRLPESLKVGDTWNQIARVNTRPNFGFARTSGHLTITGIHSYASTSGFVQGQAGEFVNVIDNRIETKDGRTVTMLGDIVHVQRSEFGPWVEGNYFTGPSDDVAHVYRWLETDIGPQLTPSRFRVQNNTDLHVGDEILFLRDDGYRQTATITRLSHGILQTDRPISGYTPDTQVVPLKYASRGSIFRDNVFGFQRAGRGSLVANSPGTIVIGNRFNGINSHAISTTGYGEYSISDGLVIQGNAFRDVGFKDSLPAIELAANLNDVRIRDNVFTNVFGEADDVSSNQFDSNFDELAGLGF